MANRSRPRVQAVQTDLVSLTQQSHAKGSTPAEIVAQFGRTGLLPTSKRSPMPDIGSLTYHEMLNMVADAKVRFMDQPAHIRRRFSNDPYQALRFCEDVDNFAEAASLGLLSDAAIMRHEAALKAAEAAKASPPSSEVK